MNLGQAVAVCLYELVRNPVKAKVKPGERAPAKAEDFERLTSLLNSILDKAGYVHDRVASSTLMKTRRLVRRLNLSAHDAEILLGMLRQIQWKLDLCYPESR